MRIVLDMLGVGMLRWLLCVMVGLGLAAQSLAEQASPTGSGTTSDSDVPTVEISAYSANPGSTGTKTHTPLIDVPQAINVVTRELMEDRGVTRVRDAIETIPGVLRSTGYGGLDSGQVFSRGFFTETTYRDGFRDFSFASPHDVAVFDRIEVLKGPASVLYGSNEPGGVVNYVTKRPTFEPAYGVKMLVGSFDARRIEADAGGPLGSGERFAYRAVVAFDEADSHRDFVATRTKLFAPSVAWRMTDQTSLTLLLEILDHEYTFERGFTAEAEMFDLPIERFLEEPGQNFAENDSRRAALMLEHALSEDWQLRAAASYLKPEAKKLSAYPLGLREDRRTLDRGYDYDETFSRDWTVQLEATGKLQTGAITHTLLAGVERSYYIYDYWFGPFDFSTSIDIFTPVYGQTTPPAELFTVPTFGNRYGADTDAVYVQDQVNLSARWQLLAGVRYDRGRLFYEDTIANAALFPQQTQSRFSPRLAAVFKPRESMSLYGSYSTSFRPQIFYSNSNGELPQPEIGRQYEIGWKRQWSGATATVALFEIRKQNVSTTDPEDPLSVIQTGEQRSRGAEFELYGRVTQKLEINAGLALLDATVSRDEDIPEGHHLTNAPRRQGSLWAKYSPQGELGWYAGGGALYTSEREGNLPNNGVKIPSGTRLDLLAGFNSERWKAQLNARNLAGRKLYDSWGNGFIIPQAGRNFSAQVQFAW